MGYKLTLEQMRRAKGITVKEAATWIGVSEQRVRRWEKSNEALLQANSKYIIALCKMYDFDFGMLLTE